MSILTAQYVRYWSFRASGLSIQVAIRAPLLVAQKYSITDGSALRRRGDDLGAGGCEARRRSNASSASGMIRQRGRVGPSPTLIAARVPLRIHAKTRWTLMPYRLATAGGVRARSFDMGDPAFGVLPLFACLPSAFGGASHSQ